MMNMVNPYDVDGRHDVNGAGIIIGNVENDVDTDGYVIEVGWEPG